MATPRPASLRAGRAFDQTPQAGDARAGERHRLLRHRKVPLQVATLEDPAAEIHQERVERAAAELEADRIGAFGIEAQKGGGLAAPAGALAARCGPAAAPPVRVRSRRRCCWSGGHVGRGRPWKPRRGGGARQDHPLIVMAHLDGVASLTRRAVAHAWPPRLGRRRLDRRASLPGLSHSPRRGVNN